MIALPMRALLGAVALTCFAGIAQAEYRLTPQMTRIPSEQMAGNSGIVDCTALDGLYEASGLPRGNSIETIRAIDRYMKKRISYRKDPKGAESWNSYAGAMLKGESANKGDCDDYALTAMHLAICAGVPADSMDFAGVQTRSGGKSMGKMDHAYAIYISPNGSKYVFGDTMGRPRKLMQKDKVLLKVSAAEIGRGMQMSWRSTIPVQGATKIVTSGE